MVSDQLTRRDVGKKGPGYCWYGHQKVQKLNKGRRKGVGTF